MPVSRSMSHQRSPQDSPRRSPRSAIKWCTAYSRCHGVEERGGLRGCPYRDGGRMPVRCHSLTRSAVRTTAFALATDQPARSAPGRAQ